MYAILNEQMALRSWPRVPYAYYSKAMRTPSGLDKDEFEVLLLADGKHDICESEVAKSLLQKGFMRQCEKGQKELSDWQKHKKYDNRLMPSMNLQITGRCNYNCRHCFNATDNHALQSHMSLEQIEHLLDEAAACGVHSFTITGGEPMVHKDIRKIISAIYDRDMYIFDFNTNGFFIDEDFLEFLKPLGMPPTMKISFDGVGFHDEMRGFKGAQEDAIRAIKLCREKGFPVMAQVNVNKNNISSIPETMELLDSLKVKTIRLIRTTEVPRWIENGGKCLSIGEYYDSMTDIMADYISKPRFSDVIVWQFLRINPYSRTYSFETVSDIRLNLPICRGNRGMIAVGANGNIYPCMQMSGTLEGNGIKIGNVFETPLKDLLQSDSDYMKCICMSIEKRAAINGKCSACKYLKYCGCGCPAISVATANIQHAELTYTEPDVWKCYFFEHGYYEKVKEALKEFTCTSPEMVTD